MTVGTTSPEDVTHPWRYGAKGNGVDDDTTSLQDLIDDVQTRTSSVAEPRSCVADGGNRSYRITDTLTLNGFRHATFRNFNLRVDGALADVLLIKGMMFSSFENITIQGHDGGSFGDTADYAIRFERDATYGVVTMNTLTNVKVIDLKCKTAFAFGPNSSTNQVDNFRLYGCLAYGNNDETSVDTTWWQNGFLVGSGSSGNILNYDFYGCIANKFRYGSQVSSVNAYWRGGAIEGAESAFFHGGGRTLTVDGVRVESCQRFYDSISAGATMPMVVLRGIQFDANALASDTYWIRWQTSGVLRIDGCQLSAVTTVPVIRLSNSGTGKVCRISGMVAPFPPKDALSIAGSDFFPHIEGWIEQDSGGAYLATHGDLYYSGVGPKWWVGTTAEDIGIARQSGPLLKVTGGKLTATAGIGVGNSASATVLGSVAKKIQVFDADGSPLGYVPVYDAIT